MAPNKPEESAQNVIEQPISIDYDHFINDFSKLRQPSVIRELNKLYSQKTSDMVSLAGGLPNVTTFPFKEIQITLSDDSTISLKEKSLYDALQYIPTQGYPPLLEKLRTLQLKNHRPPCWDNSEVLITPGSQDGLCKAIEMSLSPGEPFIVQHPLYTGTDSILKPYCSDLIPVEQDGNGIIPELLKEELEKRIKNSSDSFTMKKGIPKLLYVNPTGANPTGVILSTERKKEIYKLACKYNLIILEDDPYYYLHFDDTRPVSFLSLDTEGRVLRFDSFSKIMSPGIRLGFVTGPKQLISRIELHVQAGALHACSLSQVIIDSFLEKWGFDGFFEHLESVRKYYKRKKEMMIAAAEKHLTGLAEWNNPTAGMFLWIKVKGLPDTFNLVGNECIKHGVMLVMGHAYSVYKDKPSSYLRACFSLATPEQIEVGMERLAKAIRVEQERYKNSTNSNNAPSKNH
ncbi:kynurenine/alpha-aminoadipate aminotransferase, putative [Pediculus humanus corporis]|uniref:Kynurenine/alpha-aminoadipate aminotransferase, putative n=1 Tax=Pediculus humanus subsp. corporis TaxID=121224 RepID=E0V9A9_PEDHC|nr:kynurenine/alpha-aminoadipate aminotransferase, putative [Pediculus humanus corporis]EEB09965.1 kynurenine/alpha-aminoadipate aminotransferase, putative [Pediculus humanus corporis]